MSFMEAVHYSSLFSALFAHSLRSPRLDLSGAEARLLSGAEASLIPPSHSSFSFLNLFNIQSLKHTTILYFYLEI